MSERPATRLTREDFPSEFTLGLPYTRLEFFIEREAGRPVQRSLAFEGELLRLGSHSSNDVVIADSAVSRFHLRVLYDKTGWRVTDSGSLNGTRVNGVRVYDANLPATECVIEAGNSRFRVREVPAASAPELASVAQFGDLEGRSIPMRRLFAVLERIAKSDANVLIEGESGTGKELVATEIVRRGPRAKKPFVIVDCSAISPNLIESELFGHARGAFTGADRERVGAFEAAHGGTMFLDEIGEMPVDMQPKLLRALEAKEIRRIGETQLRKVDVRVVAATNRKLEREVNQRRFREDLYFRLSVVTLRVPSLRERIEDIPILVRNFLDNMNASQSIHLFTEEVLSDMSRYDWPGNVRELRNFVERTVVLQSATQASPSYPPGVDKTLESAPLSVRPVDLSVQFKSAKDRVISDFERRYISSLLEWAEGNISRAARKAGMDRMNLYRLIQRYHLREPALKEE